MKVLLIDDLPGLRHTMARGLASLGFVVEQVEAGEGLTRWLSLNIAAHGFRLSERLPAEKSVGVKQAPADFSLLSDFRHGFPLPSPNRSRDDGLNAHALV
jgi:CheY-like chemotaxis protein